MRETCGAGLVDARRRGIVLRLLKVCELLKEKCGLFFCDDRLKSREFNFKNAIFKKWIRTHNVVTLDRLVNHSATNEYSRLCFQNSFIIAQHLTDRHFTSCTSAFPRRFVQKIPAFTNISFFFKGDRLV